VIGKRDKYGINRTLEGLGFICGLVWFVTAILAGGTFEVVPPAVTVVLVVVCVLAGVAGLACHTNNGHDNQGYW